MQAITTGDQMEAKMFSMPEKCKVLQCGLIRECYGFLFCFVLGREGRDTSFLSESEESYRLFF